MSIDYSHNIFLKKLIANNLNLFKKLKKYIVKFKIKKEIKIIDFLKNRGRDVSIIIK